ncbi:Uncharacterized protein GA0116948_104120 [Chitinophaga costaii]|uniref:Photosynthesis system II assembly factor Ycf48/Hcf136-like domain-containing protein n=1 Tax=Chitinophaga costaii TaxID=1335309 RepID=A0A1C4CGW9_9BACT|nr:YCF48-related protein [Chitinophaga costaii]PUZ27093.1 oxidoreductase [Chitinophaga costaii]SCC18370.1 Uncharacterized protein GA0116948_104120 [Chitinophaga costaii]
MTLHRMRNLFCNGAWLLTSLSALAQRATIAPIHTSTNASFRGLSVVNAHTIWVSGTGGTVGRSLDGGHSWQWQHTAACDSCDWRSIAARSDQEAFVINAGSPARLLHTTDGGITWEQQYYNDDPKAFFDCLQFDDRQYGFAVGDPIGAHFMILYTFDGGKSWQAPREGRPPAHEGDAAFAASNSNIVFLPGHIPCFITGGTKSYFISGHQPAMADTCLSCYLSPDKLNHPAWKGWQIKELPLLQGQSTTGAFAIAFSANREIGVVVGGDYAHDTIRTGNCALTHDGGRNWEPATTTPWGYCSGVTFITTNWLVATGTSGTGMSEDGGKNWHKLNSAGFNTVKNLGDGRHAILAGGHGKIALLEIEE